MVSYYDQRNPRDLLALLDAMSIVDAGCTFDVCIVANRASATPLPFTERVDVIAVVERENSGMNIGAWDRGWRTFPQYDAYLFLQDECQPVRAPWLASFRDRAEQPGVGLVGESLNEKWDYRWDELRQLWAGSMLPEHYVNGYPAPRVAAYLDFFRRHGIDPGAGGRHLRSLVWYAKRRVLERIDGFPIGRNYGECIAAEIGVSKKVEAAGFAVVQVAPLPFFHIRHREWVPVSPRDPHRYHKAG